MKPAIIFIGTVLLVSLCYLPPSIADTPERGQRLVEKNCQGCHDNSMFTRRDSIIFSLSALDKRVRFCESMARADWAEADKKAVIEYLNNTYYHFDK